MSQVLESRIAIKQARVIQKIAKYLKMKSLDLKTATEQPEKDLAFIRISISKKNKKSFL